MNWLAVDQSPSEVIRRLPQVSSVSIGKLRWAFTFYLFLFTFHTALVISCHLSIGAAKAGCGKRVHALIHGCKNRLFFSLEFLKVERAPSGAIRPLAQVSGVLFGQLITLFKLCFFCSHSMRHVLEAAICRSEV